MLDLTYIFKLSVQNSHKTSYTLTQRNYLIRLALKITLLNKVV